MKTKTITPRSLKARIRRARRGPPLTGQEAAIVSGIRAAMDLAHATSVHCGWYKNPKTGRKITRNFGELIALMHSELSETLKAYRQDLMDDKLPHRPGIEVEFADCCLRIFDTAQKMGLDLAGAIVEKNRYNLKRADHKLANRLKPGGKKF